VTQTEVSTPEWGSYLITDPYHHKEERSERMNKFIFIGLAT
jgi:hypothetical protein